MTTAGAFRRNGFATVTPEPSAAGLAGRWAAADSGHRIAQDLGTRRSHSTGFSHHGGLIVVPASQFSTSVTAAVY